MNKKTALEAIHYVIVFAVILAVWVPVMNMFAGDWIPTAIAVFVIFVITDQVVHRLFGI